MKFQTISPVDNSVYIEKDYSSAVEIEKTLQLATMAQEHWQATAVKDRANVCLSLVDNLIKQKEACAEEICWQMGRPVRYCQGELAGFAERARHMISIAEQKLSPLDCNDKPGFNRYLERVPLGTVFSIVPWNYPYLTAVNSIIPAIMAGNTVIMKPSLQTPLTATRIADAAVAAGLPKGVFNYLFLDHAATEKVIDNEAINFISFTGSVSGGHRIIAAAQKRFVGIGLELGGKDPAYVRSDAKIEYSIENLVDGAFFNSGQSCCGIERIYVHETVYETFVDQFVALVKLYKLDDPSNPETTLGPVVNVEAANRVRQQISQALANGGKALIDTAIYSKDTGNSQYLAPQVLIDVDHSMLVMSEESFGPVVGIMQVNSDEEAIRLMNDSEYGLTASVWTIDEAAAIAIGQQVQTGTWFMNRCDYLDPALAWTGVKNSGRGCTLSEIGYEQLTRPKSFHLKNSI